MAGVVYSFEGQVGQARILRDDVLDSLYGPQSSAGVKKLLDSGLSMLATAARTAGIEAANTPFLGLHPGTVRATSAASVSDLLRVAALLYSSLANLDKIESPEESDVPLPEEVNRRFSTEVKDIVSRRRPDLASNFGRSGPLIAGGQVVRFGYLSSTLVAHFSVMHPARQSASVRDARARLWELASVVEMTGIGSAALITAVPRLDDATLGERQRKQIKENTLEITREADASNIRLLAVHTADEGAQALLSRV